jgi:NADPH:quinone reductase-like Zn-dependent oxidoreductase
MKAIVQERYGDPDGLAIKDLAQPEVGDVEVLVQVVAAGLHVGDVFGVRGSPFPVRFERLSEASA